MHVFVSQRYVISVALGSSAPGLTDCRIQANLLAFVSSLENYEVTPESERELYGKKAPAIADPARRREAKIKQYQKEKEIRSKVDVCVYKSSLIA